jgi:hypothetical protein
MVCIRCLIYLEVQQGSFDMDCNLEQQFPEIQAAQKER